MIRPRADELQDALTFSGEVTAAVEAALLSGRDPIEAAHDLIRSVAPTVSTRCLGIRLAVLLKTVGSGDAGLDAARAVVDSNRTRALSGLLDMPRPAADEVLAESATFRVRLRQMLEEFAKDEE
jgi:hypothetical protein